MPFIAIFCHVIETADGSDLPGLQSFVTSLQSACAHSKSLTKLHNVLQTLHNVALSFVEQRRETTSVAQNSSPWSPQTQAEFDRYLYELGLAFGSTQQTHQRGNDNPLAPTPMAHSSEIGVVDNSTELATWFNGNQRLLDVLQDGSPAFLDFTN